MVVVGAALCLGALSPAVAQEYSLTGNDLLRRCEGPYASQVQQLAHASFCTGYLQGMQQMQQVIVSFREVPALYCEPTQTGSYDQLQRVVVMWLKANPEHLHRDARLLVARAIMDAFPCQ